MNETMNNNNNNQQMLHSNNPVSKVNNGSKTKNEAFTDTLKWCRRASEIDNCPQRLGGSARNADTTCTCLHAIHQQLEGKEITDMHTVDRWS